MFLNQYPHLYANNCFKSNITEVHIIILPGVRDKNLVGSSESFFIKKKVEPSASCSQTELSGWSCTREQSLLI